MSDEEKKSYVEVLEILKHVSKEDFEKIPKDLIEYMEKNKDKKYIYLYDGPDTLRSPKTDKLLVELYVKYVANEDEKARVLGTLKENEIRQEEEKKKKYNPDDLFEKKEVKIIKKQEEMVPIEEKSLFRKIIDKILNVFKKS